MFYSLPLEPLLGRPPWASGTFSSHVPFFTSSCPFGGSDPTFVCNVSRAFERRHSHTRILAGKHCTYGLQSSRPSWKLVTLNAQLRVPCSLSLLTKKSGAMLGGGLTRARNGPRSFFFSFLTHSAQASSAWGKPCFHFVELWRFGKWSWNGKDLLSRSPLSTRLCQYRTFVQRLRIPGVSAVQSRRAQPNLARF